MVEIITDRLSLAEDQGICKTSCAGRHVHGRAAGEVEHTLLVRPAVRVPRPAGNRVVDDGEPAEEEDERWDDLASIKGAPDHDGGGNNGEHHLVHTKNKVRHDHRARGGGSHDASKAKIVHVADKGAAGSGKRQAEAPEHPLEDGNGDDGERLEQHGESRLALRHSTVEQTETRNDQEDEKGHENLVDVVELETEVLCINVRGERVPALRRALRVLRHDGGVSRKDGRHVGDVDLRCYGKSVASGGYMREGHYL